MTTSVVKGLVASWREPPRYSKLPATLRDALLEQRGLQSQLVTMFLSPSLEADPLFGQLREDADWLRSLPPGRAVLNCDYDVDGCTSAVILGRLLGALGWSVGCYVPNRFTDSYGVNYPGIEEFYAEKPFQLLVTVDCGATELTRLSALGEAKRCSVMVIDHHKRTGTPGPHLREINQQLHAGAQENGYSAAVLSLMLAEHVASHVPPLGKHLTELRVLAGLSAMADMVSMRSIASRFAARQCLLNTHSQDGNLGLRYLAKAMNLDHVLTSSDVGFRIAPLFNAAGRMSQAGLAIRLFNSVNVNEAASLTDELKEWNEKRRERQMEVENQAMPRFQQGDRVLLEFDQQWHPGVVGPAAGRLVERLGVPVFLGGYLPDMDMFTFSARSVDGINIHEMLCEAAKGLPISFGGHAVALGMKVAAIDAERVISDLRNRLNSILIKRKASVRQISAYLSAETVGDRNFRQVCELEPFGVDNPAPFFCIRDVRMELKPMAHSQVDASGTAVDSHGRAFDVVVFRNHALASQRHIEGDVIGQLIESRFAGQRKVKLNVHDIVPKKERVHSGHSV